MKANNEANTYLFSFQLAEKFFSSFCDFCVEAELTLANANVVVFAWIYSLLLFQ